MYSNNPPPPVYVQFNSVCKKNYSFAYKKIFRILHDAFANTYKNFGKYMYCFTKPKILVNANTRRTRCLNYYALKMYIILNIKMLLHCCWSVEFPY